MVNAVTVYEKEATTPAVRRNRLPHAILTGACHRPERANPSHGAVGQRWSDGDEILKSLGEPCAAVLEAGWNWGVMYDWLAAIDNLKQVELAHPFWVRAIAAAQVKTDAIDAHTLAQLLPSNLIPRAYVPGVGPDACAKSSVSGYSWCGYEPWSRIASTRCSIATTCRRPGTVATGSHIA